MKYAVVLFILFLIGFYACAQQKNSNNDELVLEYYQSQRFGDAYTYLKQSNPEPVTDLKVLGSLAYSSQMAGKLADAEGYYQRIYDKDSTGVVVLFNLGGINMRRGNNLRALGFYKKILQKDSTNVGVYKQLAILSKNTGDAGSSAMYLQKTNKLDPQDPDVAYDLVSFYVSIKFYMQAVKVIDPALAADTVNLLLLQGKAQVSFVIKDYKTTVEVCQKLINQGEKTTSVISWLGESYYMLKRYEQCISAFQLLDAAKTENETSYYYIAMSYKALHQQRDAIKFMQLAVKEGISVNINSYYEEIADSYDQLHQLKKAVSAYQKSMEFGEKPMTYYSLATLFDVQLKDKRSALKYYKKYLASKPPQDEKYLVDFTENRIAVLKH